jgi:two-component system chemotaxis sensor kinase CheA
MDEIVKDFLIESNENLDRLDQELVKLETDPSSKELLASIFRTIHTIKGSCGFLGFARLEKLTHAGENLLSRLRDSKLSLTEEITSGLLAMVDAVRQMLYAIQSSGEDGNEDHTPLIAHLGRLQQPQATRPATLPVTLTLTLPATLASADALLPRPPSAPVETTGSAPIQNPSPDAPLKIEESPTERAQEFSGQDQPSTSRARNPDATPESIRVGVNLLDRLMNLVGELVLARNQLLQFSNSTQDVGFQVLSQRMNLIASELREEVMRTRMQPIGKLWSKFPRTVRDLALSCGKEVRVEMEGKETELDRTIIEAIKDPLTHLVRNSVDHGIESPEDRKKAGKDPTGRLVLRAFHEGGQVNIEISDDGAGLNVERIRSKAIERGLVAADQAARMQDRDIFNLIFLPGFSTVEKVSNVSGRGVGMDVVKPQAKAPR